MLTRGEIAGGIDATLRMVAGDPAALRSLDVSEAGFWRSFRVGWLLLPLIGIIYVALAPVQPEGRTGTAYILVQLIAFLGSWYAYPLLLALLGRSIGLTAHYVPYIVARNMSALVGILPFLAGVTCYAVGLLNEVGLTYSEQAAVAFNAFLSWRVARIAGRSPIGQAIGFVILERLVDIVISLGLERILGY